MDSLGIGIVTEFLDWTVSEPESESKKLEPGTSECCMSLLAKPIVKYERKFSTSIFAVTKLWNRDYLIFFSILSNNNIHTVDGWVSYLLILALINCRYRQHLCKGLLCYLNLSKHNWPTIIESGLQFLPSIFSTAVAMPWNQSPRLVQNETNKQNLFYNNWLPLLSQKVKAAPRFKLLVSKAQSFTSFKA